MIPKFRAWDKEFKIMSEVTRIDYRGEFVELSDGEPYLQDFSKVELMQSTGLIDKNGKEVFIGDIIKCTRGCQHEVYLEKEYGGKYIGGMPAVYLKDLLEGYAWTEAEKIIGNIWENPELLEVE